MTGPDEYRPMKILLGVDGSEHSFSAIQLLLDLPLPAESSITALAVLTPFQTPGKGALLDALQKTQTLLQKKGIQVMTGLLHGHPAEELIAFSDEHNPDLIVIGAIGLRATLGILLGGVAQQVVEYACWPVLVVRAPYTGLRRILLVIDGSEHSRQAVEYLCGAESYTRFPLPAYTVLEIMHVLPPLPSLDLFDPFWPASQGTISTLTSRQYEEEISRQTEEEECSGKTLLAQVLETLEDSGMAATQMLVRGDAATEIINYVGTHKVDLILAGSRGLSRVKGWLLGSVSRKLVHYAGCSVLVVKSP